MAAAFASSSAQSTRHPKISQPTADRPKTSAPDLLQHYNTARTFGIGGDAARAASEYRLFLSEALGRIANGYSREGKWPSAVAMFNEGIGLEPDSAQVRLDYGNELFKHDDLGGAKQQAQKIVELSQSNSNAQYLLGRCLYEEGNYEGAKAHLEAAVKAGEGQAGFAVGYDLARTYLKLKDINRASVVFDEMTLGYGDTAKLHIYFGYAYLMSGVYDRAIPEFKRALEKDPKIKGAHYLLGLSYLSKDEDKGWDENAAVDRA